MKYEYRVQIITGNNYEQTAALNAAGADGWELVTIQGAAAYFRRLKIPPAPKGRKPC